MLQILTLGAVVALIVGLIAWRISRRGGDVAENFLIRNAGSSTPYEEQFSEEQALVMQSRFKEALESFEHRMALTPGEPRVRIAAADLYRTHGNDPNRAAELYREVQRLPNLAAGHDIYVSNKLADLYIGPLKLPGKALVEFRKLADRHPRSVAAKNALLAINNLKPQIVHGAEPPPPDVWEPPKIERPPEEQPPEFKF